MAAASLARTIAAALGMSVSEVEAARGGAANWMELLIGHMLHGKPLPRASQIPLRVWQRLESRLRPPTPGQSAGPLARPNTRVPRVPPRPGSNDANFGRLILTPNSTNVYGFQWSPTQSTGTTSDKGTLYVTFLAHGVSNTVKGHEFKGRNWTHEQAIGTPGRTVGGKLQRSSAHGAAGGRGPTYFYANVPQSVFLHFLSVKDQGDHVGGSGSPGTSVWSMLRVRGSVHGHQYQYGLYQGQLNDDGSVYIPRKATQAGFKTRSLRDAGTGQGGFRTSTLPEQQGYSSRRPRP